MSAPDSLVLFEAPFNGSVDGVDANGPVKPLAVEGKVSYAEGRAGAKALVCGGDGALVKYPVDGHVLASQGTIEMWVKAADWPKGEQAFHIFFETQGPGWLVLYKFWSPDTIIMLSGVDQAHYGSAMLNSDPLIDGQWHHLAGVWGRERLALYVDGALKSTSAGPGLPQSLAGWFYLGDAPWSKPHDSHTLLSGVKIYRYAMPDDQVALMAQGKPVTYRPEARLKIEPHPVKGQWKIIVDATGYASDSAPGTVAMVEILNGGKVFTNGKVEKFTQGIGNVSLDISKLPVGPAVVRARVLDGAGKELAHAEATLDKPKDAPWIDNKIGMDDKVVPPFTAMKGQAGVAQVECWGRKYDLSGAFPVQIESVGAPMLAAPVSVSVATNKGDILFAKPAGKVLDCSATRAHHKGSAQSDALELTTESTLEYDGMLWTEVTLTPKAPTTLTDVTIRIPVQAANALYYHHVRGDWDDDNAGALPDKGYESASFQPFLWVGDNDRGLAWFADSYKGWSDVPGKPCERIVRDGGVVEMRISVVNQSTLIKEPFHFSFGLQATPVKPRPANARAWRGCGVGEDMHLPGMGNIQILWFNDGVRGFNYLQHFGYPWPDNPEKFRAIVADLHARNIRAVPYVNLNYISAGADEFAYYGADWRDYSMYTWRAAELQDKFDLPGACPHSKAWRDFIAYKIAKFVDEFQVDGIYVDCWQPHQCLTEEHGCGWRDAAGQLQGNFAITDYREIVRRVRQIFADRRPDPCIIIHMSADVVIPQLAFADMMLDGEQYQGTRSGKDDYLGTIPLDKWRAEYTGRQWGVLPIFLMEFSPFQLRTVPTPTERLMGLILAHDSGIWPIWCFPGSIFGAWKAVDRFGIVDANFLPYWEANGVTADNKDYIVSVYQKQGKSLLVVLNTGKTAGDVNIKVDPKRLGLGANWSAKDAFDDSAAPVADQAFKLAVPERNYRLIVLQ